MGIQETIKISPKDIDIRLNQGVLNKWYPVHASWAVRKQPVGITRLSEKIVLWRGDDGQVRAIEDRCPHRGARLSLGWNKNESIACWYHGFELDGSGTITDVPAVDDCPLISLKCLKSYPVKEHHGAIFLFFGDAANVEPTELELPEQLNSDAFSNFLVTAKWNCNYRYAAENVLDPMHGVYLHGESHSMAEGEKRAVFHARKTDTGFVFEKKGQTGVNFDWTEFGSTGVDWMRLALPYGKEGGPGGSFGIIGMVTPVDEVHSQVFFWRTREVQGWERGMWRLLYKNRLEKLHWNVLAQDELVLNTMNDDAREHENLYQHDMGLSILRTTLRRDVKVQLTALAKFEAENMSQAAV